MQLAGNPLLKLANYFLQLNQIYFENAYKMLDCINKEQNFY